MLKITSNEILNLKRIKNLITLLSVINLIQIRSLSSSSVFCIPQRVVLSIMCFFAIAIAYAMRVCLSVAITEMVAKQNHSESGSADHSICPADPVVPGDPTSSVTFFFIPLNEASKFVLID